MSRLPRRARESRALYARVPDAGSFRVNSPAGFLHDFLPIPVPGDAGDIAGMTGPWWYGSDVSRSRTTGSPLTEPSNRGRGSSSSSVLPAVTRCVSILTEAVVRTRWLYRDGAGRVMERPLWINDPMLLGRAPGPIFPVLPLGKRRDRHSFYAGLMADALLWGRGAFTFIENTEGQPIAGSLVPLNPFMLDVGEDGHVILDPWGDEPLRTDHDGRFELNGDTWRVAVLSGMYPDLDGRPQGVLLRHFDTFRLGARVTGYLDSLFTAGVPSGYLSVSTPHFGMEQVQDPDRPGELVGEEDLLKRRWMEAHGRGRRSVAVLNSSVAYTPIALNPVDSEVAKVSDAILRDIAHAFGMSSIWLDIGVQGMSYSNSSERRADLVSMTAAGWGEKVTALVSSLLPYGTDVSVNWPTFIAPSTETLMPALVQAVQAGILAPTEARQMLGFVPWTGPDDRFEDYLATKEYGSPIPIPTPDPDPAEEATQ